MKRKRLTFTLDEFCRQVRISRTAFYDLQKRGEGPSVIRLGRRVYIAQDTAREWLRNREESFLPVVVSQSGSGIPGVDADILNEARRQVGMSAI